MKVLQLGSNEKKNTEKEEGRLTESRKRIV